MQYFRCQITMCRSTVVKYQSILQSLQSCGASEKWKVLEAELNYKGHIYSYLLLLQVTCFRRLYTYILNIYLE